MISFPQKCELLPVAVTFFLLFSCDILRVSPFEVLNWTPGGAYHAQPEEIVVSLSFSHDPDQASVERHFSLNEDGSRVKGAFRWDGRTMAFIPLAPLEKNRDYSLHLSAEAHDSGGLSLDAAFEGRFTTRPDNAHPALLSFYPGMNDEVDDPKTEVRLVFSMPVSLNSLYDTVSFNPSMNGSWRLTEDGSTAVFTPSEPWTLNKRYEMRISSSLADSSGMVMGKDFLSAFVIGTDHEKPFLIGAWRLDNSGNAVLLDRGTVAIIGTGNTFSENPGWEKGDRLKLEFSKQVDGLSVKNCLSAEGASGLAMETMPGFNTEFIFRFDTRPAYGSRFSFRLKAGVKDNAGNESAQEYVYRIFADGGSSKPPELVGIRLPMAPGNVAAPDLTSYGIDSVYEFLPISDGKDNYPSGESINTWIEFYFDTATDASVDPFSLMELFRIQTSNNVLSFSPRRVKTGGFSVSGPNAGWEHLNRLEITGVLVNSTNYGMVHFQIGAGLMDTLGNKNEKPLIVSLLK